MKIKAELKPTGNVIEINIPTNSRKEAMEQFIRRHPRAATLAPAFLRLRKEGILADARAPGTPSLRVITINKIHP